MAPATQQWAQANDGPPQATPSIVYLSVVFLIVGIISLIIAAALWVARRKALSQPRQKRQAPPPTPQIAIQEYKGTPEMTYLRPTSVAITLPGRSSSSSLQVPRANTPMAAAPEPQSSYSIFNESVPNLTPSASMPVKANSRLSLNLPTSFSFSSDLHEMAHTTSSSSQPSLTDGSTTDSTTSHTSFSKPFVLLPLKASHSDSAMITKAWYPGAPKPGHASTFTLPPILTSPVFPEITGWQEPITVMAMSVVTSTPLNIPTSRHGSPALALSDTDRNIESEFRRFSSCAFTSTSSTCSGETGHVEAQFPMVLTTTDDLAIQCSQFDRDDSGGSPQSSKGDIGYLPAARPTVDEHRTSLPPWDKVALLRQLHSDDILGGRGTTPESPRIPDTPATLTLPAHRPYDGDGQAQNTPDFFFRGIRSQIFESPAIPFDFDTPATDADGFDERHGEEQEEDEGENYQHTPKASPTRFTSAPQPYSRAPQMIPLDLSTNGFAFVLEPSLVPADTPDDVAHKDGATLTPAQSTSAIASPSPSGSSLSNALVGIGLAFVQASESVSSTTYANLARLSLTDSIAAKRGIARALSQGLSRPQEQWVAEDDGEGDGRCPVTSDHEGNEFVLGEDSEDGEDDGGWTLDIPSLDALLQSDHEDDSAPLVHEEMSPNHSNSTSSPTSPGMEEPGTTDDTTPEWVVMLATRTSLRPSASSTSTSEAPLCPPLVVVTSPSVGTQLRRFESAFRITDNDDMDESDSDYGTGSESEDGDGSEGNFSLELKLQLRDDVAPSSLCTTPDPDCSSRRASMVPTSVSESSTSASAPSSTSSSASSISSTRSRSRIPRRVHHREVVDFTENGKHTVQVVHRPRQALKRVTVVRSSGIPRYRARGQNGRSPRLELRLDAADLLVNETFPGGESASSGGKLLSLAGVDASEVEDDSEVF